LAGKCFIEYRRRGGQKRSPLPDFYIGAHAAVTGRALLTRDPRRYRSFFPRLELISPCTSLSDRPLPARVAHAMLGRVWRRRG
jgi:predicted nucleic acid-binding protein